MAGESIKATISVEKWRCIAYLFFWTMCGFAIMCSKVWVAPYLAAGPAADTPANQMGCGPFNLNDPGNGVVPGDGFSFPNGTHLTFLFGFPNICVNWDYSPARELTAMYFPLFEYSLVVYLVLDFIATTIAFKRGDLAEWFYKFSKGAFGLNVLLCIWFRMIFVCKAYENVNLHTAGFLGLQIALILVAVQNTLFVIMTEQSYNIKTLVLGIPISFSTATTAFLAKLYLGCLLVVSAFKISFTMYVVGNGVGAPVTLIFIDALGMPVGKLTDTVWMIFNAVLPLIIAIIRMSNEEPLEFDISIADSKAGSGEGAPLLR